MYNIAISLEFVKCKFAMPYNWMSGKTAKSFKKSCCLLQAKACARSTGQLLV